MHYTKTERIKKMKFYNGNKEVFKGVGTKDRATLAMLLAIGDTVEDSNGVCFKKCDSNNHVIEPYASYGELTIKVKEVR